MGLVETTKAFAGSFHENDSSGHDWGHVLRVWKTAAWISEREQANQRVCELAALLHDVDDWKLSSSDQDGTPGRAIEWLKSQDTAPEEIETVVTVIREVSYKGAGVDDTPSTLEGAIVQDADRLDAMGAIGVARVFAYGAVAGRTMHDPDLEPKLHGSFDEYRSAAGTTINHFHEKLLLLKDRMNTRTGRDVAMGRHEFLEDFLSRFLDEWDGRDIKK